MNNYLKSISVITVTWNCKRYLKEFLDSLDVLRGNSEVEVIVIDNASNDGTVELVREHYPDVTLIASKENLGFARGNNLGMAKSSGEYICLVNPDVRIVDHCIEKMHAYMESQPDVGLLGPKMLDGNNRPSRSYMGAPTLWRMFCRALALDVVFPNVKTFSGFLMPYFDQNHTSEVDILNGWFWMTRREAVKATGPLDEAFFMYAEDLDWSKRFRDAGWKVVYYSEAESIHYGGGASSNAPVRFSVEMQKANFQYWQKHYGRASQTAYLGIVVLHQVLRLAGLSFAILFKRKRQQDHLSKIKRSLACLRWALADSKSSAHRTVVPSVKVEECAGVTQ